jgi:predicted permease
VSLLIVLLVAGSMLSFTGLVERFFLNPTDGSAPVPLPLYVGTVISGLLLLELSFLWMTGLQSLPTYLGSQILPFLETLPLSPRKLNRVALIVLLRLFDAPAATALVLTPLAIGLALHSAVAGLLVLPAVCIVIVIAMGLALLTGRFFVRRVQGARGGSRSTVLRWFYLLLWAVPAFGIYGFVSFSFQIVYGLNSLGQHLPAALGTILLLFPFPLGLLPVFPLQGAASFAYLPGGQPFLVALAAALYGAIAVFVWGWIRTAPRALSRVTPEVGAFRRGFATRLQPVGAGAAVLLKDLRSASRTPGYAFLILLPLIDAIVIGLSSYVGTPGPDSVFDLGAAAVTTSALLATFFGPAFFATEVMGYSYTRTLPLSNRSLLLGKTSLIVLIYLLASAIVVGLTVLRLLNLFLFLAFIVAELPGLIAAAFVEIGLLFRRAEKTGTPISMLSSGAWWATAVVLPGLAIAGLPILLFQVLRAVNVSGITAFASMAGLSLVELALFSVYALGLPGRGRG